MENNDYGLLYDAAVAWKELTEYSFTTQIKADYLISSATTPVDFIFIIKSNSSGEISICDFVCCSAFMQTKRDYRENQRPRSILKKEQVHIATNTTKVLFDRLNR